MDLQPGDTIPGPIRLERVLYRRRSGVIWLADHVERGPVSVKVPSAEALAEDEELAERFRLESRATTEIHSEHVVSVLQDGLIDGVIPFVVMEALEGESLRGRLERLGTLPVEDADRVVAQTAAGLSAAHAVGIIHRDINPETIFLHAPRRGRTTVKIVDFGVAKVIGGKLIDPHLTRHGRLVGTPAYVSPERASAKKPTPDADMWSLAVVAYEILVGKRPFEAKSLGEQLVKIIRGDYEHVSTLRPELGREMDDWFEKAFAQEVSQRFNTVHDMATAFSVALAGTDDALDWSL